MPIRPSLIAEIQAALGPAIAPSLTTASAVSDVYEAYIFALILQAARVEGASISFHSILAGAPSPFVFRTSPTYLNSRRHNYGYARIEFPRCPALEAHVGVRVSGHSSVLHECDVSVLHATEGDVCRAQIELVAPRSHKVVIAVEAKFYTTDLALHLGRGFLGLVTDISAHNSFFVINREARSIEQLLTHKKQKWERDVVPGSKIPLDRFTNAIQKAFTNFQASFRT